MERNELSNAIFLNKELYKRRKKYTMFDGESAINLSTIRKYLGRFRCGRFGVEH